MIFVATKEAQKSFPLPNRRGTRRSNSSKLKLFPMNLLIGVWITISIVAAFLVPEVRELRATPIAFFHVPMAITMFGCFFAAAACGLLWLFRREERWDNWSLAWGEVGFAAGCITFLTGLVFAGANWGAFWTGDPQQVGVLGTLLLYAAMLSLRSAVDDDRKKRNAWAVYSLFGLLVACFGGYIYSRIVPQGVSLHPNGTLKTSSQIYKIVFTFNIVGFLVLMSRVAWLRAKMERIGNRLRELSWEVA